MVRRPRLVLAPPGLSVPICAMAPGGGGQGDAGSEDGPRPESQPLHATPTPHTDNSVLCEPSTALRPLPLPTVLTGTRCSNLVVLGWGWPGPVGWQASPGFGPGTYNQLLPL